MARNVSGYKFIEKLKALPFVDEIWLAMLDDRNNTSHAYKEEQAQIIFEHIKAYLPVFQATYLELKKKYNL